MDIATDRTNDDHEILKLDSWNEEMMLLAHVVQDPRLVKRVVQQIDTSTLYRTDCMPEIFDELIKVSSSIDGHMTRNDVLTTIRPIISMFPTSLDEFTNAIKLVETDTRDGSYYIRRVVDRAGRRMIMTSMQPRDVLTSSYNMSEAIGLIKKISKHYTSGLILQTELI
jgi:hypothetical protein